MAQTLPDSSENRILFLDNLRFLIVAFVVLQHAGNSYGSLTSWWAVWDPASNTKFFDATRMIIDVFIMPLLFFIAGYFALPNIRKKGPGIFLKDKFMRLGIPLLIGIVFIAPIFPYIYQYTHSGGQQLLGYGEFWIKWMKSAAEFYTGFLIPDKTIFNHSIYWFISLLLFFFIIFAILYALKKRFLPSVATQEKVHSGKTMLLVMLIVGFLSVFIFRLNASIPYPYPDPWVAIANVLVFQSWRLPVYIIYFALGIYAFSRKWFVRDNNFPGHPLLWISICIILCFGYVVNLSNLMSNQTNMKLIIMHVLLFSFLRVTFLIVFTSIAFRYWNRPHKIHETLAANSYNIYLVHLPIVVVLQLLLYNLTGMPSLIKYGMVFSLSFLVSYVISRYAIKPQPSRSVAAIAVIFLLMVIFVPFKTTKPEYSGPKVKVFAKNAAFFIARSSALNEYVPNGFLIYFIPVFDEKGEGLKDPGMVKEVQLLDPSGAVFKTLRNREYIQSPSLELSGYSKTNDGYVIWQGFDSAFHSKNLPTAGNYQIVVTSISGDKESTAVSFNPKKRDPITGFPSAMKYDSQTRTVTWNPTSGQTGYIVSIYKGNFNPAPALRNRVSMHGTGKNNLIIEPKFTIPDTVALSSNEQYYIMVQAYCIDGNEDKTPNYMNMQTNFSETAIFSGDGKGVAAEKKEMSK